MSRRHCFLKNGQKLHLAVAVAALLIVPSMFVLAEAEAQGASMTTLRIGMVEPIDSLNPFMGVTDNAYIFYGLVYDFLVAVDEDMKPQPNLALEWWIVPDAEPYGSVWQYNLTENAFWHDGEPFDADDVVWTYEFQIGANWKLMWAYQPYTILVDSVEKVDKYTVRLHFADRTTGIPTPCAFGDSMMVPILPEHLWRDMDPAAASATYTNPKPVGTGPFMCTDSTASEWQRGDRLILYKNPDYHGTADYGQEVKFDRLILEFYLEPAAMVTDIQRGAIDLTAFDAPSYSSLVDWLSRHESAPIGTYHGLKCTSYSVEIGICMEENPGFNPLRRDFAVRQALAYATDKEFIRDHIYMGYSEIGSALLSPIYDDWYWAPDISEEYSYNIAKANEVLDLAGYVWNDDHTVRESSAGNPLDPAGGTPLSFGLLVEEEMFEDKAVAMFLQDEWAEIGVQITPEFVDTALWSTRAYGAAYEILLTYWSGDPDPNYLLYIQSSDALGGWSENWYSSPYYDENYTNSLLNVDPSVRLQYVINCQKLTYNDAAFIVYGYPYGCYAWREDHFTGWGDWSLHPGRQESNFWSACPLFFDLVPVSQNEPPIVILDNVAGPAGQSLAVTAFAWDPEGAEMEYILEFGDGSNSTGIVPEDGEMSFAHTFSISGTYAMNLTVSDGEQGSSMNSDAIIIASGGNAPPSNIRVHPDPMKATPGTQVMFTVSGKDLENDPVSLRLNFSDGTADWTMTFEETSAGFEVSVAHTFAVAGDYDIILSASDGNNETVQVILYSVVEEDAGGLSMTLMLGIVVVVVVVAAVALLVLRRRRGPKEEEEVRLP